MLLSLTLKYSLTVKKNSKIRQNDLFLFKKFSKNKNNKKTGPQLKFWKNSPDFPTYTLDIYFHLKNYHISVKIIYFVQSSLLNLRSKKQNKNFFFWKPMSPAFRICINILYNHTQDFIKESNKTVYFSDKMVEFEKNLIFEDPFIKK